VAGLLPDALGFALGALATRMATNGVLFRDTALRIGELAREGEPVELGDVARWGAPTGVTLDPSGTTAILGQRRERGAPRERLVELELDCHMLAD
jgi:hypothetical protein